MTAYRVPLFIRGELIEQDWVAFGTRGGDRFEAPDPAKHVARLPLASPADMTDLYGVRFAEILDVLEALGHALAFGKNPYLQEAFEAALVANPLPESILRNSYVILPPLFAREAVREIAEARVGIEYLEGWVPRRLGDGREIRVRAFGSRTLHMPAGNGGLVSAVTILRSVITRSDAIIKAPSNDPLTAMAIARTLGDVAPDHPITRHLAVGYWKGGDRAVEDVLYRPEHVEKIVAWGGLASVKHVTRYIQLDEPVDYSAMLSGRVANLVPVDDIAKVTDAVNAYTQTIGIYPESLKRELRDRLPLFGAQRLTSLGYACSVTVAMPQDAIEPIRRMCKWIVDEECDPERVPPMWKVPAEQPA